MKQSPSGTAGRRAAIVHWFHAAAFECATARLRRWKADLTIMLMLALLLSAVWTVSFRMVSQAEGASIDSAFADARNLSRLLALEWSARLRQIDSLHRIARNVTRAYLAGASDASERLDDLRQAAALPDSGILQVAAISAGGEVIWSTIPLPPGRLNVAEREYYLMIARDGKDSAIGRSVLGAVSEQWSIHFAEAQRDAGGTLLAVTVVVVGTGLMEALAREFGVAEQGVIGIVRGDGIVLARSADRGTGEDVGLASPLWRNALETGTAERLIRNPLNGVPRFFAARRVAGFDLVLVVGLDEAGRIAPVRGAVAQIRHWSVALSVALVGLAAVTSLGIRRQRSLIKQRRRVLTLDRRERLLRQMTENLTDMICLHDVKGRYVEVGRAALTLVGEPPERLVGRIAGQFVLPEDRPHLAAAWRCVLRDSRPQRLELRIRHAGGEIRWLETEIVAVAQPAGSDDPPDRFLSVTRDVTQQRAADRRLNMLVAAMPGILAQAIVDADGTRHLTYVSDSISKILGYSPETAKVPGFFDRLVEPDIIERRRAAIATQQDGGQFELRYRVCRQDGGFVWMQETATVRDLPDGRRKLVAVLTDMTAQHEAEIALARARADLDAIVADGPGVLFRMRVTEDGGVQPCFVSTNAGRVLGYSQAEMLGPGFFQSISEMSSALAEAPIGQLSAGESLPLEFRYRNPAGAWNWLRSSIHLCPTEEPGGELVGVMLDVTGERASAKALAEAQRHLEVFAEAGPGVLYRRMFGTPQSGKVIYVSPNVERVLGLSVLDAMSFDEMERRIDPATVPPLPERMAHLAEQGTLTYTVRYHDRSGMWRWMRAVAQLAENADGQPEVLGMCFDVTSERIARDERDQAKAELAAMAQAGPGALYRLAVDADSNRKLVHLGENFTRLTGWPPSALLGGCFPGDRFDPATLPSAEQRARETLTRGSFSHQYRFRHAAGHWIWLLDTAAVVTRHPDGSYDTIGYLTDITREKDMAAQVAQAGKMAVLGEMATGMAHELNQPLTAISLAAENGLELVSEDGVRADLLRSKLARISEQARRAGAIIDHMRIFGRREAGPPVLLRLADAVAGARLVLGGRLRLDRIALETDLPADLPPVLAQSLHVEQVLVNLLANACDAYKDADPAAERWIRIAARTRDGRVLMQVADSAGGIREPNRVFEPFYTTKKVGEGTGLGLSISYGIIADLGGHLSVRNQDAGAVFEIDLPAAPQEALC